MKIPNMMEVLEDYPEFVGIHPACEAVPPIDEDAFDTFIEDIKNNGLREPILRTKDNLLLDGRTRLAACWIAHEEIRVVDDPGIQDPWVIVNTLNIHRRHLTLGQIAMFRASWKESFAAAAKQRQKGGQGGVLLVETFPQANGKARDQAAVGHGCSGRSVDKAAKIKAIAPDVAAEVLAGRITLESGYKESRNREEDEQKYSVNDDLINDTTSNGEPTTPIFTADGRSREIKKPKSVCFNKTNDSVDWANWTWNPVTGCEHGCSFCYARAIANSERMAAVYPNKFEPTYHPYRLAAPGNSRVPKSDDSRDGRVFVCSMADLFGKWVPIEWIEAVFDSCLRSPEWEYLFLTKWPARYSTMPLLEKAWYGASVIQQSDVSRVEKAMKKFETKCVKWISLEPMLGPIKFSDLSWCDLVVIGGQTGTSQPTGFVPEFAPEFDWIFDVVTQCRKAGVPYYLKANIGLDRPGMKLPKSGPRVRG